MGVISGEGSCPRLGFMTGKPAAYKSWGKQSQSDPTEFELELVRSRGPIKVWDVAQLELAPMGFTRARCQKWVNIKLNLMKNRRKQSSPYLLEGAKVSRMVSALR